MRWIIGALLVAGCARDEDPVVDDARTCDDLLAVDLPDCAIADACDTGDSGDPIDCVHRTGWSASCAEDFRAASGGLTQAGVLYVGDFWDTGSSRSASFTITDAASYEAWWNAEFYDEPPEALPAVDFGTQLVVVVVGYQSSTCGLSVVRHGVWSDPARAGDPTQVYVEFEDSSGSCWEVCDMDQRLGVVYAVDRDRGIPDTCALLTDRCG